MDRSDLEALYRSHHRPRTDGGLDFTLDDYLHQVRMCHKSGMSMEKWSKAVGLPLDVVLKFEQYVNEQEA